MSEFISTTVIGLLMAIIGIVNMSGNISSLHWYHRQRVTEENRKPFGKRVGLGTLICGISCMFFGVMSLVFERTSLTAFIYIGGAGLLIGLAVGIIISLLAIQKYNKGLF